MGFENLLKAVSDFFIRLEGRSVKKEYKKVRKKPNKVLENIDGVIMKAMLDEKTYLIGHNVGFDVVLHISLEGNRRTAEVSGDVYVEPEKDYYTIRVEYAMNGRNYVHRFFKETSPDVLSYKLTYGLNNGFVVENDPMYN